MGTPPSMGWLYSSALSSRWAVTPPDSGVPSGHALLSGLEFGLEAQPNPLGFLRRHRQFPGLDAVSGVGPGEEQQAYGSSSFVLFQSGLNLVGYADHRQ